MFWYMVNEQRMAAHFPACYITSAIVILQLQTSVVVGGGVLGAAELRAGVTVVEGPGFAVVVVGVVVVSVGIVVRGGVGALVVVGGAVVTVVGVVIGCTQTEKELAIIF